MDNKHIEWLNEINKALTSKIDKLKSEKEDILASVEVQQRQDKDKIENLTLELSIAENKVALNRGNIYKLSLWLILYGILVYIWTYIWYYLAEYIINN